MKSVRYTLIHQDFMNEIGEKREGKKKDREH